LRYSSRRIYAADESLIREHAQRGGFRVDRVAAVRQLLDPVNFQP
jgi:hypothetical protein